MGARFKSWWRENRKVVFTAIIAPFVTSLLGVISAMILSGVNFGINLNHVVKVVPIIEAKQARQDSVNIAIDTNFRRTNAKIESVGSALFIYMQTTNHKDTVQDSRLDFIEANQTAFVAHELGKHK